VKLTYARGSLLLFALSVLLLFMLTRFESSLVGMPAASERVTTFFLLVLPASLGAALGITSLRRGEGQRWQAIAWTTLNSVFALFHLLIVFIAG
jgi:hypothetical protein